MSLIEEIGAADQSGKQTSEATGREMAGEPLEEKREVNNNENMKGTEKKLLELLTGLVERM